MNISTELTDELIKIALSARTGNYSNASSNLNLSLSAIEQFVITNSGNVELIKKITYSTETLLMIYENKDWVAFADIIEYELVPLLSTL